MKKIDEGVVLKRINYSDSSIILTLLTRRDGLQRFVFQGGKKKAGAIYPLSLVEFTFYRRPDSELGKLTAVQSLHPSSNIPFDPARSSIAFFLAEVILQTCKTEEADDPLFDQIKGLVHQLDEGRSLSILPVSAMVLLSNHLGITPLMKDEEPLYFLLEEGEFRSQAPLSALNETGKHIELIVALLKFGFVSSSDRVIRMNALITIVKYFELHVPGFNVRRPLEILRETLS